MDIQRFAGVNVERIEIDSELLQRVVPVDFYVPDEVEETGIGDLLFINDGQDLITMNFETLLNSVSDQYQLRLPICVGIHCGEDRINEYGIAGFPDHLGRGAKASLYQQFIFEELFPAISINFPGIQIRQRAFAGFSLGGLTAFDLVWNHPGIFNKVGVFSGSLWWRSKDKLAKDYNQDTDRIIHTSVRKGIYHPGLKFFFQCGEKDEAEDRNRNGVIDSIDDTIDLMRELLHKGYKEGRDMKYLQLADGKHDVASWARALPEFFRWGWRK